MPMKQIRDDRGRKITLYPMEDGESDPELPAGWRLEPADDTPLWQPPPASVEDYQFAGEAEARGIITEAECDAWVGRGDVPEILLQKIATLIKDPEVRRRVVLFLKGSKTIPREHPNTVALAAMFGLTTPEQIDDFFTQAHQR